MSSDRFGRRKLFALDLVVCLSCGGLLKQDVSSSGRTSRAIVMRTRAKRSPAQTRCGAEGALRSLAARLHVRAGLLARPAKASAIFSAIENVSAYEMFDVTATTIPRSRNVISDATIPPSDSPS
jgi:hypothetical protein